MRLSLLSLLLLPSLARAVDCPDPEASLAAAEQAVVDGRFDDASAHLAEVEQAYGCGPLAPPASIARLWRAEGARLSLTGDPSAARDVFEASGRLAPGVWTPAFGSALEADWRAATGGPTLTWGNLGLSPDPTGFQPAIDGSPHEIPANLPGGLHFVQVLDTDGRSLFARTVYLPPAGEVVVETGPLRTRVGEEAVSTERRKRGFPLFLVAAGASLAASGGMAALALSQEDEIAGADSTESLNGAWHTQQAFAYSSYGLAGLAATGVVLHFAL